MRATGRVPAEALRDLLEAAPRANLAFRSGDAIQAMPVAFRFRPGTLLDRCPADTAGAGARPRRGGEAADRRRALVLHPARPCGSVGTP
jgi:hypothetical protein